MRATVERTTAHNAFTYVVCQSLIDCPPYWVPEYFPCGGFASLPAGFACACLSDSPRITPGGGYGVRSRLLCLHLGHYQWGIPRGCISVWAKGANNVALSKCQRTSTVCVATVNGRCLPRSAMPPLGGWCINGARCSMHEL